MVMSMRAVQADRPSAAAATAAPVVRAVRRRVFTASTLHGCGCVRKHESKVTDVTDVVSMGPKGRAPNGPMGED